MAPGRASGTAKAGAATGRTGAADGRIGLTVATVATSEAATPSHAMATTSFLARPAKPGRVKEVAPASAGARRRAATRRPLAVSTAGAVGSTTAFPTCTRLVAATSPPSAPGAPAAAACVRRAIRSPGASAIAPRRAGRSASGPAGTTGPAPLVKGARRASVGSALARIVTFA